MFFAYNLQKTKQVHTSLYPFKRPDSIACILNKKGSFFQRSFFSYKDINDLTYNFHQSIDVRTGLVILELDFNVQFILFLDIHVETLSPFLKSPPNVIE